MNAIKTDVIRKDLEKVLSIYDSVFLEGKKIAIYGMDEVVWGLCGENSVVTPLWGGSPDSIEGVIDPSYFIEADVKLSHGGADVFNEKTVVSFEDAHMLCRGMLILVNDRSKLEREKMLNTLHNYPIEDAEIRELNLPEIIFCRNKNKVLSVYDILEDDLSKATYANMILSRISNCRPNPDLIHPKQYFGVPIFAEPSADEVYVDCGAFVGDTIETYLWPKVGIFKKIYAFEPFERTFAALSSRVERLKREWSVPDEKIELINAGVGERLYQIDHSLEGQHIDSDTSLSDYSLGNGTVVESGGIPIYTIDKYFANEQISFLKADIEGYEWAMLAGARKVIKRDRPKLAICIYHLHVDMFRIPLVIRRFCPEYKLYIRQHAYRLPETVLYACVNP